MKYKTNSIFRIAIHSSSTFRCNMNLFINSTIIHKSISFFRRNSNSFSSYLKTIISSKKNVYFILFNTSSFKNRRSISSFTFRIGFTCIKHITNCMIFSLRNFSIFTNTSISSNTIFIHISSNETSVFVLIYIYFKTIILSNKISIIAISKFFSIKIKSKFTSISIPIKYSRSTSRSSFLSKT